MQMSKLQFPYLDATFSEALRVTPPGAFGTIRVAREDSSLGSHRIRKGWLLNVRPPASCCLRRFRLPGCCISLLLQCDGHLSRRTLHPCPH